MSLVYAPESPALSSGSLSPIPPRAPLLTSRGKLIASRSWRAGWKKGTYRVLQSTLALSRSQRDAIEAKWISLLPDSRASHSVLRAHEKRKKTHDTSGRSLRGSLASATQLSFSWRTSQYERTSNRGETFPSTNEKTLWFAVIETIFPVKKKSSVPVGNTTPFSVVPSGDITSGFSTVPVGLALGPSDICPVTTTS